MVALVGIVGDTISEIMGRMSSFLPVFGDGTINCIAKNIEKHLLTIKEAVSHLDQDDDSTREWLWQVTDVITDLFDLVDDLSDDAALLQNQSKSSKIRSLFSLCNLTPRSPTLKLKGIQKQLEEVAARAEATKLSPKNVDKSTNSDAKEQEIEIVGRENEKEKIIKQILPEEKVEGAVLVAKIVGIQGIGKTRLAKFICDDEKVKSGFDLIIWIDGIPADDKFYAEFVVKRMIESAMKKKLEDEDSVVMDQNLDLGEAMSGSRFLLVLDDLRNENHEEWHRLQQMLSDAASTSGGAVLITTQSAIVADIVGSYTSYVRELRNEDSWSLFQQIAGVSEITDAQKEMVSKCRGVPVAIQTMARLLSTREAISQSEMNQLEKEFLRELQLRYYNDLPSWRLKQCFAYCSFIFSGPYISTDAQTLIRLWMAEGFMGPTKSSPQEPEDLGRECIQEFRRRSIFHTYGNKQGISEEVSVYNNLMLDLSAFVAGHNSLFMKDPDKDIKEEVCRVALGSDLDVSNGIPNSLFEKNKKLRSMLLSAASSITQRVPYEVRLRWFACDAIFSGFKRLRVLKLQDLGMKMVPGSIGELKSLRFLDLSKNNMKKLPDSIGGLKHLQTLKLSHCHELKELPNMEELVSLRHLLIKECLNLTHMPTTLKKLTSLQTLTDFMASTSKDKNHTGGLQELTDLNSLRGKLEILHLERLKFKESGQVGLAYLKEKQHLQCLILRWDHDDKDDEGQHSQNTGKHCPKDDRISLGHLEPNPNLKTLSIVGYQGNEFSDWLSSLKNLVQLNLYNCSECKSLPPLEQLPKLKILKLQMLDSLEFITEQDDGSNIVCNELELPSATKPFFPSLKQLIISDCPNLTSWWKGRTHDNNVKASLFPSLSRLQVQYCPKLDCMPLYPNLEEQLVLECSSIKPLQETLNYSTSTNWTTSDPVSDSSPPLSKLKNLTIADVGEQSPLPEEWLKNFYSLKHFAIRKCKGLKSIIKGIKHLSSLEDLYVANSTKIDLPSDEWEGLKSLCHLSIVEIPKLKSLPEGIKHLTSLRNLRIDSCTELTTLTEGIGELKSLRDFWISECHKLASLPQGMSNLKSLKWLSIMNCPLLLPRCQKETGDDWEHIKHIEDTFVTDTSQYYE